MRGVIWVGAILLLAQTLGAQTLPIDSYKERFYAVGASAPTQTNSFQASAVTCNVTLPTGTTVNPTTLYWTDLGNAGKFCKIDRSAILAAVPIGNYEATLSAVNAAGESAESNRAPFVRATPPSAPTNVAYLRP
jgi:PKD repeat protein